MKPETSESPQRVARWRYFLPNAITLGSMLVGLGSMGQAVSGHYAAAAWLIILCALLDKLDGSVARFLGSTSKIGTQLDSFSDFVAFGVAPATLVFTMLRGIPADSMAGPFVFWHPDWPSYLLHVLCGSYVICATVRLAKFNVLDDAAVDITGTPIFYGVPTTMTGGFMAAACLVGLEHELVHLLLWTPPVLFVLGIFMVATFPFPRMSKRPSLASNIFIGTNVVLCYVTGLLRVWPEYLFGIIFVFMVWGIVWGRLYRSTFETPNLDPYPR
jgi:CDP-diacylglycerol--serine O-phosphatidyltransferase